jgi:putative RNA 2'-phosphotransferase
MILGMAMSNRSFDVVRASKFLSYVLRHRPESIGILLDKQGWADVPELLAEAAVAGIPISLDDLKQIVALNDKKRFVLSDDAMRIRAAQGHSINVDLNLTVKIPPPALYHGTVGKFIAAIRKQGLQRMNRHDVHLSTDKETAARVAVRRGKPVILVIETFPMLRDGYQFRVSDNGVWLIPEVPPKYIKFPS